MKNILVIFSSSPFTHTRAREGQDLLMALAAVEHQVSVLYCGAGVLQLRQHPVPTALPVKDFTVQQKLFDLYDIAATYACNESLRQWAVDVASLKIAVSVVEASQFDISVFDFVVEF